MSLPSTGGYFGKKFLCILFVLGQLGIVSSNCNVGFVFCFDYPIL